MSTKCTAVFCLVIIVLFTLHDLTVATPSSSSISPFKFPSSGSFKIQGIQDFKIGKEFVHPNQLNQEHEMEWRGIYQFSSVDDRKVKIFAQSLESPLSILMQNEKVFVNIPHSNSCIQVEYDLVDSGLVSGIQKTLAVLYDQMIEPAVKLTNWKEDLDGKKLNELAGCNSRDRVFVNLLNQDYSNDALIACVNEKNIPYRIRSRLATIEIGQMEEKDSKLFESVKALSQTCVKHKSIPHFLKEVTPQQINKNRVWFMEEELDSSLLKTINQIKLQNNGTKRICVFLHGAGVRNEGEPVHEWPHYWGQVNSYTTDICSEWWFIRRNTKEHGWTSEYLQTSYCEMALIGNKNRTDSKIISNTIVFTHSMANMIFPTAMYKGYCQLDLKTSTWISVSAPFNGSPAAIYLKTLCYQAAHKTAPHDLQKLLDFVAEVTGYCNGDVPDLADASLLPNYCDPNTTNYHGKKPMCLGDPIFSYAEPMISARMCGSSAFGLMTYYGMALQIFSELVKYGEPNDGLVPISSCFMSTPSSSFLGDFTSPLYNAAVNHADATCRNGNSKLSENNKMPCSFYQMYRSPVQGK